VTRAIGRTAVFSRNFPSSKSTVYQHNSDIQRDIRFGTLQIQVEVFVTFLFSVEDGYLQLPCTLADN
jgi:hypothetical protein